MSDENQVAQERRDECRQAVLQYLANRAAVAHHPQTVRRNVNAGHVNDFTIEEIEAALALMVDAGYAKIVRPQFGATKYFQATAAGILVHERGEQTQ